MLYSAFICIRKNYKPLLIGHLRENENTSSVIYANTTLAAFNYKNNTSKFFLTDQVTNQTYSDGLGFKIENKIESFVYRETDQTIMLGTSNGLIHFNMISQKATYIPTIKDVKLNWVREICLYKNDFLCMTQKGLIIYNTNEKNAFYFKENLSKSTFSFNPINIGVDKSDRIWLCKIGEGFRILDFKNKPFYKEGTSADTGYLPPGRIMGMAELPNHEILISVGKVKVIQNNISRNIRTIKSDGTIESYNDILIADSFRNVVWKCGYNKLMYYHPISQKNTEVIFKNRGTGSVPVTNHLVPISKNEILLAGSGGLYQYIEAKKVFTPIESLPNKMAFYINPISNNRFLISYLNEEMLLVKKNENQSYSVEKKILPGVFPFYVWEDVIKKQFWLASNIGLFITDEKFKIIKKIDENNGLAGAYIYGLLSDDIGNIWVSHGHGISSIDKSTFKITNYGKEDGLQDWDFNNRSFLKTSDGTLYFGGVNGFNYFKPPLQQNQFYKPLLYIDAINYEQKPYLQDTNFNLVNKVRLNAGIQNIEIKVNIASLDAASSYQIIYRIKNKNVKWTYITNPANISLYNLAPGTYILEMGVYDKFSKIEQLQKEVVIEIIPFFYQTNWFWIIVGFFISCIIFWIITNQRLIKQKRKYEQQLSLEIEKKRISNDLHDDIGASISSLRLMTEIIQDPRLNDAKKQEFYYKINETSQKIAQQLNEVIWSLNTQNDTLQSFTEYIKLHCYSFFENSPIQFTYIEQNEFDKSVAVNSTWRKNLFLSIKEIMNNALKHSSATTVTLTIAVYNNIEICIVDNGIGILNNNPFGNGLKNISKRVEAVNGKLEIINNNGTTINISCPIS